MYAELLQRADELGHSLQGVDRGWIYLRRISQGGRADQQRDRDHEHRPEHDAQNILAVILSSSRSPELAGRQQRIALSLARPECDGSER
jgi:hypothetical protein